MNGANQKVFAGLVLAKIRKSEAIGSKASWGQQDQLSAMADCLDAADIPPGAKPAIYFRDILADTYNTSAWCQYLEEKFAASGHFQREKKGKVKTTDFFMEELDRQRAAQAATEVKP